MKPTTSITLTLPVHDLSLLTTWLVLVSEGIISDEGEALLSASDLESLHAIQKTASLFVLNFAGAARVINTDAIDERSTTDLDYGQVH